MTSARLSCPTCELDAPSGSAYCRSCGSPLEAESVPASGAASPELVGRTCPYCRFPLKLGAAITRCGACGAVHHRDCFDENRGCAITGCVGRPGGSGGIGLGSDSERPLVGAGPAAPPPLPLAEPGQVTHSLPPPGAKMASAHNRSVLVIAVVAVAVVVAGAASAAVILLGRGHHDRVVSGQTRTVIVKTPAASSPPATTGSETASARAAGGDPGAANQSATGSAAYSPGDYSIVPPAGFVLDRHEHDYGSYIESRWHLGGNPDVYFLIDHTPGYEGSAHEGAATVRASARNASDYEELNWGPTSLPAGRNAWEWEFDLSGLHKIDTFVVGCGSGYATLGAAPPSSFDDFEAVFDDATQSLRLPC